MEFVKPEVHLVSSPQIEWDGYEDYLRAVKAENYLDRKRMEWEASRDFDGEGATAAEILVELMAKGCYRAFEAGLNPNVSKVRDDSQDYFTNIMSSGHGSVLEHANFSFVFRNVSRVFTHELVRHRAGVAISQESLRFVRLTDIPFWMPDWALEDVELTQRTKALLVHMEEHQRWMSEHFGLDDEGVPFSEKKAKTSFMRRTAPIGVTTMIGWSANIRTLRHVIEMRTDVAAEEEIRIVVDQVAEIMRGKAPMLFDDYERDDDGRWNTEFRKV